MCTSVQRLVKGFRSLETTVKGVVSHPIWVLGTKLRSSTRAVCSLNSEPSLQHLWLFLIAV